MKIHLPTALLLAVTGSLGFAQTPEPAPVSDAEPMMLRLKSGGILWGAIEDHQAQELVFSRLDNGGRVTLPWGYLDPLQSESLRREYGYVETDVEEVLVNAERIPILGGSELVGLIVNRTEDTLFVKTATSLVQLDKRRVAGPAILVQVPALDIYTREELYQKKLGDFAMALTPVGDAKLAVGPEAAAAHLELARYCERIFDFEHARDHLLMAVDADPSIKDDTLERWIERTAAKAAVQDQVDGMAEADTWRARKKFERALEIVRSLRDQYPKSPLEEDFFKLEARIQKSQEAVLREEVVRRWHFFASRLITKAARERAYADAVSWADGELSDEIVEAIAEDLSDLSSTLDAGVIRRYFAERKKYKTFRASYGSASWLLGPDEARKPFEAEDEEVKKDEENKPEFDEKDQARKDIEAKIKRYVQNAQNAQRTQSSSGTDQDPEEAWKEMSSNQRAQWLRAYYAEHSGDMRITSVRFSACPTCGGSGVLEEIRSGGAGNQGGNASGIAIKECPTCHTVGIIRRVSYR